MKLGIVSDIHLEFGNWVPTNPDKVDLLVVAGDLVEVVNTDLLQQFLDTASRSFPGVLLIAGNHEYYSSSIDDTEEVLRRVAIKYSNVYYLQNQTLELQGVKFFGSTLWSDLARNPTSAWHVERRMSDYRVIRRNNRPLRVHDTVEFHQEAVRQLKHSLEQNPNGLVVITHHAPSHESLHPRYRSESSFRIDELNDAYASQLEYLMLDHKIPVWIHGHVHDPADYTIGDTRVVTNPRGYVGRERGPDTEMPYLPKVVDI